MSTLSGSKTQEKKLYRGVFTAEVLAVNPTIDEVKELTNGKINLREETPARQEQKTSTGTEYTQERVRFVLKMSSEDNPVLEEDEYTFMDFYLRSLEISTGNGRWIGTNTGMLIYVKDVLDEEEAVAKAISGELRESHPVAESGCPVEGAGEKELFTFLQRAFNLNPYGDGVQANYKELFYPDWEAGDTNWDELKENIESFNPKARVLLYVDKRGYQKVDTRSTLDTVFSTTDKTFASRLPKSVERQKSKGRKLINDIHPNFLDDITATQQVVTPMDLVEGATESADTSVDSAAAALG